jgi:hypothetical protein
MCGYTIVWQCSDASFGGSSLLFTPLCGIYQKKGMVNPARFSYQTCGGTVDHEHKKRESKYCFIWHYWLSHADRLTTRVTIALTTRKVTTIVPPTRNDMQFSIDATP